jgi:predicted phosphodiesterase
MAKNLRGRTHNPVGTELVETACARWRNLPSRTLARMLFKQHAKVWASIETVRRAVQRRRGRARNGHGKLAAEITPSSTPSVPWNPLALPKSDEKPFLPYSVTVARDARALVLGDVHVPYHNIAALRAAIERGRHEECSLVVINGDLLDFHRLSRFQKDPRSRDPKVEVDRANQLLDVLDEVFPKARRIFKEGNHDERYDHYLSVNAPELYALVSEKCNLRIMLELDDRGWEIVTEKRPIHLGKLPVIHGHEYPTPVLGPVNAARGLFLRAKACALVNHHHQTSEHTETTIRGDMITTWSLGCLCDLHPMYARFNKWNHGAATIELDARGNFQVHNFRIHNGAVLN